MRISLTRSKKRTLCSNTITNLQLKCCHLICEAIRKPNLTILLRVLILEHWSVILVQIHWIIPSPSVITSKKLSLINLSTTASFCIIQSSFNSISKKCIFNRNLSSKVNLCIKIFNNKTIMHIKSNKLPRLTTTTVQLIWTAIVTKALKATVQVQMKVSLKWN